MCQNLLLSSYKYNCLLSIFIFRTPPKDLSLWTVKGRIKSLTNDSEGDEESGAVEIAHEAEESFLLEEDNEPKRSPASSFLESHKLDLTQTLLKGLGFSK